LLHLCEEVGLAGDAWESLGTAWHALATLWLQAEAVLSLSGRSDLSFTQIRKSAIPDEWKHWMNAKLMKTDIGRPPKAFGKVLTEYLKGLPSTTLEGSATVTTEIWCRPGVTGIIGLLHCLHWQANFPGSRKEWKANVKRVEHIYTAIIAIPHL